MLIYIMIVSLPLNFPKTHSVEEGIWWTGTSIVSHYFITSFLPITEDVALVSTQALILAIFYSFSVTASERCTSKKYNTLASWLNSFGSSIQSPKLSSREACSPLAPFFSFSSHFSSVMKNSLSCLKRASENFIDMKANLLMHATGVRNTSITLSMLCSSRYTLSFTLAVIVAVIFFASFQHFRHGPSFDPPLSSSNKYFRVPCLCGGVAVSGSSPMHRTFFLLQDSNASTRSRHREIWCQSAPQDQSHNCTLHHCLCIIHCLQVAH